jgi:hypothetical protein
MAGVGSLMDQLSREESPRVYHELKALAKLTAVGSNPQARKQKPRRSDRGGKQHREDTHHQVERNLCALSSSLRALVLSDMATNNKPVNVALAVASVE